MPAARRQSVAHTSRPPPTVGAREHPTESARMTEGALLSRVRETIRRYRMLSPGDTVVVGVSGGPDSVALLHLLAALREELGLSLHVAHFNHRLRPEAAEDAAFVAALSRDLAVPYHEGAGETRAHADRLGLSVEDAARRLRYEFLAEVARATSAQAAAVGHTRDDQAETVLMRLLRGGGPRGLAGIPPVRPLDGARLVRPLIETPRAEVEAYLGARGLPFREDPTNRDPAILRNRIRLVLLPALEGYNPDVRQRLARLADLLRDEAEALDELAAPRLAEVLTERPDAVRISPDLLARLPAALQRRALREAVARAGGNRDAISFVHLEGARRLALDGRPGTVLELPGGVRVRRLSGAVDVAVEGRRAPEAPPEYRLDLPGSLVAPEFGVHLVATEAGAAAPEEGARARQAAAGEIIVDGVRAGPALVLRGPRPGDRFAPSGMGGRTKKLSDYLSEAKVPRHRRPFVPVLATSGGEILWIVGMRAAESARVQAGAVRPVRIVARKLRA
jgi:tRNA(Ile)-lysidine synthase